MTRETAIKELLDCRAIYAPSPDAPENTLANRLVSAIDMAIEVLKKEPCEDCISRREVLGILLWEQGEMKHIQMIKELPPVIPEQPVMTGEWVTTTAQAESEDKG